MSEQAIQQSASHDAKSKPGRSSRWQWLWAGLAGVVAIGIGLLAQSTLFGPVVVAETVKVGPIVQTIVASGQVQTPFRVSIGSQITGVVAAIPVAEGQKVSAGDLLIQLDDREANAAVGQARAALAQAQVRLDQVREVSGAGAQQTLQQAFAQQRNAKANFERLKKLQRGGYATAAALDEARKNLDVADAQVRAAEVQVKTNEPGGMDFRLNTALLEQARASLQSAETKLLYTMIRAPRAGTLISRGVEVGDVVQPGKALMALSPDDAVQLVVQIDEKNLSLVAMGQSAVASADAYPKQQFRAEIAYISPAVDPARGSIEVKLAIPEPPAYLLQDMTVSVEIEVARRDNAMVVASSAVQNLTADKPWVMMVANGRAERRDVVLGAAGDGTIEVVSGLHPGEQIVAPNTGGLKQGQKVRVGRRW